jgi:hypothetical protein
MIAAPPAAWAPSFYATIACLGVILSGLALGALVPPPWVGHFGSWPAELHGHTVASFFPFDAVWYGRIATQGYVWTPATPDVKQDVAFFPLWPILVRLVQAAIPGLITASWAIVAMAAGFAWASIRAFDRLALRLLPRQSAKTATWMFALYPGASFLPMSYPTGLMNLLTVMALLALLDGRLWRAAVYAGLATACGPLGLATGLTVAAMAARHAWLGGFAAAPDGHRLRALFRAAGISLLAVSGLAAFIVWQAVFLGDPVAFMKAQLAWDTPLPWLQRIPAAALQVMILPELAGAIRGLKHIAHPPSTDWLQFSLNGSLNRAAQAAGLIALAAGRRAAPLPVLLQGGATFAVFIIFNSASRPGHATLRLLYPAMGMFIGAAWLLRHHPRIAAGILAIFATLLFGAAFLIQAGYSVV